MYDFLSLPVSLDATILLSLSLLLGLLGGELAGKTRYIPKIFAYLLVGFLIGPGGFHLVDTSILDQTRWFTDLALGFVLFDLGRHLDWRWLRHDLSILWMSVTESALTFLFTFTTLLLIGLQWLPAALAATIAIATAPAVILLVAHDLAAKGPVTRRTWMLTSLNNLFSLILFTLLLPVAQSQGVFPLTVIRSVESLSGALIMGGLMLILTQALARVMGKKSRDYFILLIGSIILTIGLARFLHLPTMLTLFIFGVLARRFDRYHLFNEMDFNAWTRPLLIVLFVLTGISLPIHGLWQESGIIAAFILARFAAKGTGIGVLARRGRLTGQQTVSLALALVPMASVAIDMSSQLTEVNPEVGHTLSTIIGGVLAILTLLGPMAVQWALWKAGETSLSLNHNRRMDRAAGIDV